MRNMPRILLLRKKSKTFADGFPGPDYKYFRLEGFGGSDVGPGVADLADYPGFAKQQVR